MRCIPFFALLGALTIAGATLAARGETMTTYHYDNAATGVNASETLLAPANLTVNTFSKSFAVPVDGQVYAQPLYVPGVKVVGGSQAGTHNLALVATQHDSLYAIDVQSGVIVWQTTFLATGLSGATTITSMPSGDTGSTDTYPEIGICGTPVIDPTNNRYLYVAAKTKQILNGDTVDPHYVYTLYQVDITNGNATANANIVASKIIGNTTYSTSTGSYTYNTANSPTAAQDIFVPGTGDGAITVNGQSRVYFNAMRQMNRPAMLLYNGNLYIAFGSHGDNGPYHGWVLSYSESSLTLNGVLNTTPNGSEGGIWGGGAKPVVDASGNIYVITANGLFDGYNNNGVTAGLNSLGFPVNGNYGDSFLKIAVDSTTSVGNQSTNGWGLRIVDYFSPSNSASLDNSDTDLGGGGITLLPSSAGSSAHPNLLVGAGKQGNIYLLDTSSLGKFSATTDNVVQEQVALNECTSTPAFFNGVLYYATNNDNGKAFTISNAVMSTTPVTTPDIFGFPGSTPTVSANGTNNAIVWMIDRNTDTLRAYSASNINNEIWTSALAANNRDQLGTVAKFTTPTVADGNVLVGTASNFVVYSGPTTASGPPGAPTNLTATAISSLQINLSWTDNSTTQAQYAIEQSTNNVNFTQIATVGVDVSNYAVATNLQGGTTYYYRVRAFNNYNTQTYSAYTNVASATTLTQAPTLNFTNGFAGSTSTLQYNGSAAIVNNAAQVTNNTGTNEAGSVWSLAPQNVQAFVTQFTFQLTNAVADGFTFSLQNNGPGALGGLGGNLGYGGITNSIAIKFDLYSNNGEGPNSTGLFVNGASPYTPATDLTSSGINLHSGDVMSVALVYNGTVLSETITDTVTSATTTLNYTINIPSTIGSNTAYAGFTGGTGGSTAQQSVLSWTYSPLATSVPAAPSNLVATAASGTQINLTWTDNSNNESGFVVMRATGSTGTYAQAGVVGAGVTTFSDTALTPNVTYYYQVYATNNVGNSAVSNTASALTPVPPATPTNAHATAITSSSITMSWTNNATNATAYNIFHKMTAAANFTQVASLPPTATSYTDTGLAAGTSYDYHIQAYNLAGYSDFSGFTAVTLSGGTLPIVTVSSTAGAVAVSGVATGELTFTCNSAPTANFPITYTISGTGVAGTDYTALSGTATIPAGATSVNVPVTALPGAAANATVTASIATTASYTAGTPASATVVLEPTAYHATAQTAYGTSSVAGTTGNSVTLTFQGLPGSPAGTVYVWYYNGTAIATTTTGSYTISNAQASQSGAYSVYAYAPGGATGSATFSVTVSASSSTSSFTDADIGGPSPAGSASVASGVYTVSGGGADIYGAADQFNYYSESASGNATLIVQVTSQLNTSVWAKAGLMFRNSTAAGDAWVGVFQNPGGLVEMQWRDTLNAQANWPGNQVTTGAAVNWLELVKTGNSFSAYYATTTGVPTANNWTLIATHTTTFTNSTFLAGLAVTSHNNGTLGTAAFSNFTYPGSSTAPTLPIVTVSSGNGPLAVSGIATGQFTFTSNTAPTSNLPINYTISGTGGAGTDYAVLSGTATIPAGATSVSVPVTAATNATPNATVIANIATTSTYQAGSPSSATVVLEGTTFNAAAQTAYGSSTVTGTTGGTVTLTFQGLPGSPAGTVYIWYYNGTAIATTTTGSYTLSNALASQSGTYSVYAYAPGGITGSASFSVTVSGAASTSSFTDADIGGPSPAGSASVASGVYTVNGGGADIYGAADQFNYYSEPASGNATLIVQVTSQLNTSVWAKAGLMFRNSSAAGDAWVSVFQNPGGLVEMMWRDTANGQANWPGSQVSTGNAVNWLELVKTGNSFSAYYATTTGVPAANNWTLIATHTTSFTNSTFLAGLAVTSHNNGVLGTATFSNFTFPGATSVASTPSQAVQSLSFLNSLGVCTHISQGQDTAAAVGPLLNYAGIYNIRDDGSTSATTLQGFVGLHTSVGAKVCMLPIVGVTSSIASSISGYETLAAAGALLAVEGPNEPNNYPVTYDGQTSGITTTFLPAAEFQRDLYAAVKADPNLAGIPVFASSEAGGAEPDNDGLQFLTIPNGANTTLASGTVYADYANVHNYVCNNLTAPIANTAWQAEEPTLNGVWDSTYVEYGITWNKGFTGYPIAQLATLPKVTTETGWVTQGTNALTEAQQGKLFLNLYLDAYKEGWAYTFIYMLRDSTTEGYWGLYHTDNTPKASATDLHNFTTILADTNTFTPGTLNYSIPSEPSTMHDLLLQKSSGAFELAVWDENVTSSDSVTVSLGATYPTVNIYDPTVGATPIQTLTNVSSVPLTLSDHPNIIEVLTSATAPAPVVIQPSTTALTVNDGSTGTFTVSLASAPTTSVTVNVAVSGDPDLTVSPATLTLTPGNYQNQPVTVTAGAINSNDNDRAGTVALTSGTSIANVTVTDAISDSQTAANLTGISAALTGANIGTGSAGDSSVHSSGNWWIDGSGAGGLSGSADSFHLESQLVTGNFQMVVQLQNLVATGASTPLAGLMIRDGTAAGSNFLALAGTTATSGGYTLISRTTVNAATQSTVTSGTNLTYTYPNAWMMLTRVGNVLHAFVSSNGTNFYEVTNPTTGVTWTGMGSALDVGVFSSSGNSANARAIMSNFGLTGASTTSSTSTFTDTDIGGPGLVGSASVNAGVYAVTGGGADIWNTADQFNFYSEPVSGNATLIVQVTSQQNTNTWAKAGLMFRNSTAANDAFVTVLQNPGGYVEMQWRDTANAQANWPGGQVSTGASANWLELVANGNTFSAYYATTTGVPTAGSWVLIATHTTTFTNSTYLAGLAVTSHNNGVLCTADFSNFTFPGSAASQPTQPTQPTLTYTDLDIGGPSPAGSASSSGNSVTVNGGGADIWNAADQFNYYYATNTTDRTIVVQVSSQQNTSTWAKAGPMFRNSTSASDAFVAVFQNPAGLVEMMWRDTSGAQANWPGNQVSTGANVNWLELVKSGNTYSAYYATTTGTPTASNWILIATHTTTFTNSSYLGGLAVTSHNNGTLNTTVFSNLSQ